MLKLVKHNPISLKRSTPQGREDRIHAEERKIQSKCKNMIPTSQRNLSLLNHTIRAMYQAYSSVSKVIETPRGKVGTQIKRKSGRRGRRISVTDDGGGTDELGLLVIDDGQLQTALLGQSQHQGGKQT